jgi:hypothetical protein
MLSFIKKQSEKIVFAVQIDFCKTSKGIEKLLIYFIDCIKIGD